MARRRKPAEPGATAGGMVGPGVNDEAAGGAAAQGAPAPSPADPGVPSDELALDAPPPGLPEITFPFSEDRDFTEWAAEKRRRRIRVEMYASAGILVVGVVASLLTQTAAFMILCLLGVGGVLAYEFLVSSLE